MGLFDFFSGSGSDSSKTRDEAIKLGITVADVKRGIPEFSWNMRSLKLIESSVVKYSITRKGAKSSWSLLQRLPSLGSNMPNDYLLESSCILPDQLVEEIKKIAEIYVEEYFEFECNPSEVAVYWEEWGGLEKAEEMHALLTKLASL